MNDLDPRWRLVLGLAVLAVVPLLLALRWVACQVRDSCSVVILHSWWRGQYRRLRRRRTSTPAGPGRAPDAPGPAGHHPQPSA